MRAAAVNAPKAYAILGLPFHAVTTDEAEAQIRQAIHTRQRCFLSTPNLNFLAAAQHDPAFRRSVLESDLSVADGMPLIWLARLLGIPLPERVAGSTLFDRLRRDAGHAPIRVYFFGGAPGVAELASRRLNEQAGGMVAVGFHDPGMGDIPSMSTTAILDRINQCQPDFVVVALGARKGQAWIQHNRLCLDAPVISHLGAVINFVAGTVERAPVWMQKSGLEWLWRIKEEGALARRYAKDGLWFLEALLCQVLPLILARRRVDASRCPAGPASVDGRTAPGVLKLSGNWQDADVDKLDPAGAAGQGGRTPICRTLDLGGLYAISPAVIARLMQLGALPQGRAAGPNQVIVPARSTPAYRQLKLQSCL
jgi:N-acetylglucosaminyldiphosphoundecaprenol N-acetyl-beta-D-mannosaminyltransferase